MILNIVPRTTASPPSNGPDQGLLNSGSDPPPSTLSLSPAQPVNNQPVHGRVHDNNHSTPPFQELVANNAQQWQAPDPSFIAKLEAAAKNPNLQSCGEQTERALRILLGHGIIVNTDPSRRTLGNFIVQHLLQPTTQYDLELTLDGEEPMALPTNNRLLFVHLADSLNCAVYLFSNRAMPRVYRPSTGSLDQSRVCGIFHIVDSYLATSEYLVLSFVNRNSRRCTEPDNTIPPPVARSQPQSISASSSAPPQDQRTQPKHAKYRPHQRARKRQREALEDDERTLMKNALRAGW